MSLRALSLEDLQNGGPTRRTRLHRDFNISAAETDLQDRWQESVIACAIISNDSSHNQRVLQQVLDSVEQTWLNVEVIEHCIEMV